MNTDVVLDSPLAGSDVVLASPLAGPLVETKFMQNYRVAAAVHGGGDIVAVANGNGQVEVFTVGTSGKVWNFYPDSTSPTGYSKATTGLTAAVLAAGTDKQGRIVLFAATGTELSYVYEINQPTARWSPVAPIQIPLDGSSVAPPKIVHIVTQQLPNHTLAVGIVREKWPTAGICRYGFALSLWETTWPTFYAGDGGFHNSPHWAWMGNTTYPLTDNGTAFGFVDQRVVFRCSAFQHKTHTDPITADFTTVDMDSALDPAGNLQTFAILNDGNLYQLIGSPPQPYRWQPLSQALSFRQVQAVTDAQGHIQVFAVTSNNQLYHIQPDPNSPTGYTNPTPIYANVARIGMAGNNSGQIDLFTIGTTQNSLTHLFQEQIQTNWVAETVEVTTDGQVEEYIAYSSDITLFDAAGAPLVETPVQVWSPEESRITVNGATYFIAPQRPARLTTNSAGQLAIWQETGALGIPALQLNIPALMMSDQSLVIEQSAGVQDVLTHVTGPQLSAAKDASGHYILPAAHRNEQDAATLAEACNSCMTLAEQPPKRASPLLRRQGPRPGVWMRTAASQPLPGQILPPTTPHHWQLSFGAEGITYQTLTATEAEALLADKQAIQAADGEKSWFESIGDFLASLVEGLVDLVHTFVTTVIDGVHALFTFVLDGITHVFDAVITWVGQAFDIIEVIFAKIAAPFQRLFEWLGEVFGWADILRTQDALSYTMDQMLDFLQGAAPGIKRWADAGIDNMQSQVGPLFDDAVGKIAGTSTVGGYEQHHRPTDPRYGNALSNNIVYNGMIDNAAGARLTSTRVQAGNSTPFAQFLQEVATLVDNTEATAAFAEARAYFQNLGDQPDQIFTQALAGLLRAVEGVIQTALSNAQAIVDKLLDLVPTLVTMLKDALHEEWNIPFVSSFYTWLTTDPQTGKGKPLTILDLITLIVAIPATVGYKIMEPGASAPFPDEASLAAFKNSFNAQMLLQASGLGRPATRQAAPDVALRPNQVAGLMGLASGMSTCAYGLMTAWIDSYLPPTQPPLPPIPQPYPATLRWTLGLELAWQTFSCPWYTASGAPDCSTGDGAGRSMWIYQWLSFLVDAGYVLFEDQMPESESIGAVGFMLYGVGHLLPGIVASGDPTTSGLATAGNIIPTIPEMCKILRFAGIVEASGGQSLKVLAGVDGLFYMTSALITLALAGDSDLAAPVPTVA